MLDLLNANETIADYTVRTELLLITLVTQYMKNIY